MQKDARNDAPGDEGMLQASRKQQGKGGMGMTEDRPDVLKTNQEHSPDGRAPAIAWGFDVVLVVGGNNPAHILLDFAKEFALLIPRWFKADLQRRHGELKSLRVKLIVYRSQPAPAGLQAQGPEFYQIPEEIEAFEQYVSSLKLACGGEAPKSPWEALSLAMQSGWRQGLDKMRHLIFFFPDNPDSRTGSLQFNQDPESADPALTPEAMQDLYATWMNPQGKLGMDEKRMFLFAPFTQAWSEILSWPLVLSCMYDEDMNDWDPFGITRYFIINDVDPEPEPPESQAGKPPDNSTQLFDFDFLSELLDDEPSPSGSFPRRTWDIDIVYVVDGGCAAPNLLEQAKNHALDLCPLLSKGVHDEGGVLKTLRVKLIVYGGRRADDGKPPVQAPDFYSLPDEAEAFERDADALRAARVLDGPEGPLDALLQAFRSEWQDDYSVMRRRQIIVVVADPAARPMGFGQDLTGAGRPSTRPTSLKEVQSTWINFQRFWRPYSCRLAVYAPNTSPWNEMTQWNLSVPLGPITDLADSEFAYHDFVRLVVSDV